MIKLVIAFIVAAFLSCSTLSDVVKDYTDCGSTGVVQELRINPCPSVPCQLKKQTFTGIEIDFIPKEEPKEDLEMLMYGIIGPTEIPFDGVSKKACDNILDEAGHTLCPLSNITTAVTYNNTFEIKRSYPPIEIGVEFKLSEKGKSEPIVCLKFRSQIIP